VQLVHGTGGEAMLVRTCLLTAIRI
jgi:hypothetical protein